MVFKDVFDLSFNGSKQDRVCSVTLRLFGVDVDIALYGYINDVIFPVMIVPSLRGIFMQSLFLGVFIGRLKDGGK